MNTIKAIVISTLSILTVYSSNAQNGFKEPVSFKLKNGMTVIVSENSRSPKAYSSFTLEAKAFKNKKDGVVELFNALLNESVEKNSNICFKDNSGKLATTNADFDKELSTMASVIQNVDFDQNTFNKAKAKLMASLKLQDYDYDQTVNENSIGSLTLSDVKDFYDQITPDKSYLTIAGDVETTDAKASAKKAFGNWDKEQKEELIIASVK